MTTYKVEIKDTSGAVLNTLNTPGCVGIMEWTPDIAGIFTVRVKGTDSRDKSVSIDNPITVTDYEPIGVTLASTSRIGVSNRIKLEMMGTGSKVPTIKFNYTLPSSQVWSLQDDYAVAGACTKTNDGFAYVNEAFSVTSSEDIITKLIVSDGVTAVELMLYIPSSKIISITTEYDAGDNLRGKVRINGQGVMAYMGVVNIDDATIDSGIYQTTFNGNPAFLEVLSAPAMKMQRLTLYHEDDSNRYDVWLRFCINSSFTEWKQIY